MTTFPPHPLPCSIPDPERSRQCRQRVCLDALDNRVRKISAAGTITTFAGDGLYGQSGDGGPASSAQIASLRGVGFDPAGNLYEASGLGAVVRRVAPSGTVSTLAGSDLGFSGDGGLAVSALLSNPFDAVGDAAGNIYISDANRIRRVDSSGFISTFAGTGTAAFGGDDGPLLSAQLSNPHQMALRCQRKSLCCRLRQ